ncbi:FecR family protein [Chitinophaga sp. sic0106]|uniref:FecR domain-containing protein n=1 Tax=Chitinophaga sp. sic0106 TaxID=2854785 RepID=UPI001C48D8F0|nr:FecR domain-containing protein [Chitinophaga sp. sic0106]
MNNFNEHINDDILVKFMLGQASAEEQQAVGQWMAASADNEKYFQHFRLIWEESRQLAPANATNENEAWARFQQRVNRPQTPVVELTSTRKPWLRIAAAVTVLIVAGTSAFLLMNKPAATQLELVAASSPVTDTLPDGSIITLNKNSRIQYASNFDTNRHITLEGEAFFNVATDPSHPFVLKTGDVQVRVLGTSFNVKSNQQQVEVIVETGAVEVNKKSETVQLQQNEKAVMAQNSSAIVKASNKDELYNYYRTQTFVCNGTPLWQLAEIFSNAYGVKVDITNTDIRNEGITSVFMYSTIEENLRLLEETSQVKITVEKVGDTYILK